MKKTLTLSVIFLLMLAAALPGHLLAEELVIYSARNEHLIEPLFEKYEKETGVSIQFRTDNAGALIQRLIAEGGRSRADILITVDAGNLWYAAQQGLFYPVASQVLEANIPSHLRDPGNRWFGLSVRARTIVYSTERVDPGNLSTYQALGDPQWKDRLVLRTSKKVYNQSLVAMLISERGVKESEKIVRSWVDNLSSAPYSSDTKVMEAILARKGDVGIVNTYYYGRLLRDKPDLPLALYWPDQSGAGVHINVSGAGVLSTSSHKLRAVHFLEWLSSPEAQKVFAEANMEYPATPGIDTHPIVNSWGTFRASTMNLAQAGELQTEAIKLMDRADYR
ncbi:extracellular solute-binding protein [bacterium]|nr:extracellular solute-binding protein [bacterium]